MANDKIGKPFCLLTNEGVQLIVIFIGYNFISEEIGIEGEQTC